MAAIGAAADPRITPEGLDQTAYPAGVRHMLHDPNITLEEYMHHAEQSRAEEERLYGPGSDFVASAGPVTAFVKKNILHKPVAERETPKPRLSVSAQGEAQIVRSSTEHIDEKVAEKDSGTTSPQKRFEPVTISDEEWVQASRAARTATW